MEVNKIKIVLDKFIFSKKNNLGIYGIELLQAVKLVDSHKLLTNPASEVLFRLRVENSFCNLFGTMHGGAICTLVDTTTTVVISAFDKSNRSNVSVELSTQYLNPVNNNTDILILCKVPKIGKTLAYSYAEIYDEQSLKLLSQSTHIKAILDKKWDL